MNAALVLFYGLYLLLLTGGQIIWRRDRGDSLQGAVNNALHRLHRTLGIIIAFVAGFDVLVNRGFTQATFNILGVVVFTAMIAVVVVKVTTRCRVTPELPQAVRDVVRGLLERLPALGPATPMMMATGMTRAVFHVEHRPKIAIHQEQGGSDSDDANGNHHANGGDQNRDEPPQSGAKVGWDKLLAKLQTLRAEFYAIKNGKEATACPGASSG